MHKLGRRSAESGQTIVLLALLLGILMVTASLVLDIGSQHRIRTETHYVCDAGALAGVAELLATGSASSAHTRAMGVVQQNGYQVGQNGVTSIEAIAFNHQNWPEEDPSKIDIAGSDRYRVTISRELPYYLANVIGFRRGGVTQYAVAAIMSTVPIPSGLGSTLGFPDKANLSQFGPDAPFTFGDCYSPKYMDTSSPPTAADKNGSYDPNGYVYDITIPEDAATLRTNTGSSYVRVEVWDPDTINRWPSPNTGQQSPNAHVVTQPYGPYSTTGDPNNPDKGGLDEIRHRSYDPGGGNAYVNSTDFPRCSTQTDFILKDGRGNEIAHASFGPSSVTRFWMPTQEPGDEGSVPPAVAIPAGTCNPAPDASKPELQQLATDLRWVTPAGFQFDIGNHPPPFTLTVRTVAGSSENGYSLRVGRRRALSGATCPDYSDSYRLDPANASAGAMSIFAHGRVPINIVSASAATTTGIAIASVAPSVTSLAVTNFDTDVGYQSLYFNLTAYQDNDPTKPYIALRRWTGATDATTRANYGLVQADNNDWYASKWLGQGTPNGQFHTDTVDIPTVVAVPRCTVDASGDPVLVYNGAGKVHIDVRNHDRVQSNETGTLNVIYTAGQYDTSVWEVSTQGGNSQGNQTLVLIR